MYGNFLGKIPNQVYGYKEQYIKTNSTEIASNSQSNGCSRGCLFNLVIFITDLF